VAVLNIFYRAALPIKMPLEEMPFEGVSWRNVTTPKDAHPES
jgi:hypothetical protein